MLLTTKLNKTKTINNIITWHEVLNLLKQEELLKITLTCTENARKFMDSKSGLDIPFQLISISFNSIYM